MLKEMEERTEGGQTGSDGVGGIQSKALGNKREGTETKCPGPTHETHNHTQSEGKQPRPQIRFEVVMETRMAGWALMPTESANVCITFASSLSHRAF